MFIIKRSKGKINSLPVREIDPEYLKSISSKLAHIILKIISENPCYPKEIAKKLKIHEQKVYYHIRNLEKSKIIEIVKKETVQGAVANYYSLTAPSFFVKFKEFTTSQKIFDTEKSNKFLDPFIDQGKLNAKIIVGSPDPHGPEKARSRDGYYGIDLALFLGTFLHYSPQMSVKLDTETKSEDLQENLIIFGGPVINIVEEKINHKLPIRFDKKNNWDIVSNISNKTYHTDETGIVVKIKNPFNNRKYILLIAGKRYAGTKAVIISFLKYFDEICKGNNHNNKVSAKVVEGIDIDSDGIVDDVSILE